MKRKTLFALVILLGLLLLFGLTFVAFYHPQRAANPNFAILSAVRAVRVDYLDVGKSRGEVVALEKQMQQIGVNMVALSAGRADWTYFPWRNHSDRWSTEVKTNGLDYLLEDSTRFSKWAHVSAVVDVLAPLYIQAHPETAAVSWLGVPSQNIVGTMELVDGQFGQDLLDMINEVATYYPVNSVTLSELVYYTDGFGDQDKAAYLAYTGRSDWPRNSDGNINIDDPSIGSWRSYEIGLFIARAADIVHAQSKQLFVDARARIDENGTVAPYNGTDFDALLTYADRLVVWGNHDLDVYTQASLISIAQFLVPYGQDRVIMMLGLWDRNYDTGTPKDQMSAISADEFKVALTSTKQGGMSNLIVSPSFLMSSSHWQVLQDFWSSTAGQ
jgi:hypothetical protein